MIRLLGIRLAYLLCILFSASASFSDIVDYSYDDQSRLTGVGYSDGTSVQFVYDNLGNRLVKSTEGSGFVNNPPGSVSPLIASGATDVSTLTSALEWTAAVDPDAGDEVAYYLYFGAQTEPPLVCSGLSTSCGIQLHSMTTYYWKVVARDSHNGQSANGEWSFTTGNQPPAASIDPSLTDGIAPYTATLEDSSISTDDDIVTREWDFNDDGVVDSTAAKVNFTVSSPVGYPIRLTVTDEAGASDSVVVTLNGWTDVDGDGLYDQIDNCPNTPNSNQADLDADGAGDVCDDDIDGDGVLNASDPFPYAPDYWVDSDADGIADEWEYDKFGNFGDLTTASQTTDYDGDGSTDLEEFLYESDPFTDPGIVKPETLSSGGDHNIAMRIDGKAFAWGYNYYGQVGDGTHINALEPSTVFKSAGISLENFQAVAAGGAHSLALKDNGEVIAWGRNLNGQLGNGTTADSDFAVQVVYSGGVPIANIEAIAAGGSHSLALKSDGTILSWGLNNYGQLGDDSTQTQQNFPVNVVDDQGAPLGGIIAVAAGEDFSAALKSDGTVFAWGRNGAYGQLGDGGIISRSYAARVVDEAGFPVFHIKSIAVGGSHALALKEDGSVISWGFNGYGQLGDQTENTRLFAASVLNASGQPLADIQAVAAGGYHSLALTSVGSVLSWGENSYGQLGDGSEDEKWSPTDIGLTGIVAIAAGSEHSLALSGSNAVWSWGRNSLGELGRGSSLFSSNPSKVIDSNLEEVALFGKPWDGNGNSFDSDRDGEPDVSDDFPYDKAWKFDKEDPINGGPDGIADGWERGNFNDDLNAANATTDADGDGSLDIEEFKHGSDPKVMPAFQTKSLAAGYSHSLGLQVDGTVLAWGYNSSGQLGDGYVSLTMSEPVHVKAGGTEIDKIVSVAAGDFHSLALRIREGGEDGTVLAWGSNYSGQLGDGTTATSYEPVQVLDASGLPLRGIIAIAAGDKHSLALKSDGTVLAWGDNGKGQLGDGTNTNRLTPTQLRTAGGRAVTGVKAIAAGGNHSMALKENGTILSWGDNMYGQLGDGSTINDRWRPIASVDSNYNPLSGVIAIAAGLRHSMALKSDGTVWSWGAGSYGQLGNNNTSINYRYAVKALKAQGQTLTGITSISAGDFYSLAIGGVGGNVYSWGLNADGQLGDGSWSARDHAEKVLDAGLLEIAGIEEIAAGGSHGLALKADGTLYVWGDNAYSQLSSGTTSDFNVAVSVIDSNLEEVALFGKPWDGVDTSFDSDRDGVADVYDAFPYDAAWSVDGGQDEQYVPDGIDDDWERSKFGDLDQDGSSDKDGDGSLDIEEFKHGSEPDSKPAFQTKSIAAGSGYSIGLQRYNLGLQEAGGTLLAWGANSSGQLGDGTTMNKSQPVPVMDGGVEANCIMSVSTGASHGLALKNDGTVLAWGSNYYGQLGDGTTNNSTEPVEVLLDASGQKLKGIIAIAAGLNHSMALKSDGTVWLWGCNSHGQLGDGETTNRLFPVMLRTAAGKAITGIKAISGGYRHSMALKAGGEVLAWGNNYFHQLGDGTSVDRFTPVAAMDADNNQMSGMEAIAAGYNHSMALKSSDGTVLAWGYGSSGQLGNGASSYSSHAVQVIDANNQALEGITSISAGYYHSLAIGVGGSVYAWGRNADGQVGDESWSNRNRAEKVLDAGLLELAGIEEIAAGGYHNLALEADGTLYAWGDNSQGQLSSGILADFNTAAGVVDSNFEEVALFGKPWNGIDSSFDSDRDNVADADDAFPYDAAWSVDGGPGEQVPDGIADGWEEIHFGVGNLTAANGSTDADGDGSLDIEEFKHGSEPNIPPAIQVKTIAAGRYHSLGLRGDGTILSWGRNYYGQLGDGTTIDKTEPVPVTIGGMEATDIVSVAAGESHSLALKADGTVLSWGYNYAGQLGDGTTNNSTEPVEVLDLAGIIAITAGDNYSMALKSDDTVWLWGDNSKGQLGDGTNVNRLSPVLLSTVRGRAVTGIAAIAAGQWHSLALKADGTVLAWGDNANGRLGDGATTTRRRAMAVVNSDYSLLSGIEEIAAGSYHSMALKDDGTIWSWGNGWYGQLGDEANNSTNVFPVEAKDGASQALTGVLSISAGVDHSVALVEDVYGSVFAFAWGRNADGQLGDGSLVNRNYPAPVVDDYSLVELTGLLEITAGASHNLALDAAAGTIWSWGDNYYGQLGDGTTLDRNAAIFVRDDLGNPVIF